MDSEVRVPVKGDQEKMGATPDYEQILKRVEEQRAVLKGVWLIHSLSLVTYAKEKHKLDVLEAELNQISLGET